MPAGHVRNPVNSGVPQVLFLYWMPGQARHDELFAFVYPFGTLI